MRYDERVWIREYELYAGHTMSFSEASRTITESDVGEELDRAASELFELSERAMKAVSSSGAEPDFTDLTDNISEEARKLFHRLHELAGTAGRQSRSPG